LLINKIFEIATGKEAERTWRMQRDEARVTEWKERMQREGEKWEEERTQQEDAGRERAMRGRYSVRRNRRD